MTVPVNNIPPEAAQLAHAEQSQAQAAAMQLRDLHVETPQQIAVASEILIEVKRAGKAVEDRLEEITRPMNEALRSVRALFKPARDAYGEAEKILKTKIGQAQFAIQEANRRAMEATQQALAAGQVRQAAELSNAIVPTSAPAGISFREQWTYRIVNAAAMPREFLMPDDKKIRAYVQEHGDKHPIPGVEVTKSTGVIARTG